MKQEVSLSPGQSQPVSFKVSPTSPTTYQVSLDGLSDSFVASAVPAHLQGTVRDSETGDRIQNALVELNGDFAHTNQWGEFSFTDKESGTYTLTISKDNYDTKQVDIFLQEGNNYEEILLVPEHVAVPEFQISNLTVSPDEVHVGEQVTIGVDVENVGDAAGTVTLGTDPDVDFQLSITPGTWSPALVPAIYRPVLDIGPVISLMMVVMMMTMATRMMK